VRIDIRELEGRPHYVVPVVMITEGVHNGSQGPLYYPADELRQTARYWDGKPVVVYHPDMYTAGSAGNPTVFNKQKVGTVFNTRFEHGKLKADAWIDVQRVAQVDRRVFTAIQNQQPMEVSTGLFTDNVPQRGNWNGKRFDAVARNYRPDHLAILPDQVGACSLADGAGLIRNAWEDNVMLLPPQWCNA